MILLGEFPDVVDGEWAITLELDEPNVLALSAQVIDDDASGGCDGAHGDYHRFGAVAVVFLDKAVSIAAAEGLLEVSVNLFYDPEAAPKLFIMVDPCVLVSIHAPLPLLPLLYRSGISTGSAV